mgnify:CR=1 FL=1
MNPLKIFFTLSILNLFPAHGSETWIIEPAGNYEINLNIPQLGGLSSIKVYKPGKKFVTISDKGIYFEGHFFRDSNGVIKDIEIVNSGSLLNSLGTNLSGRNVDSESITSINDQGFYISFESNHRIMFHETLSAAGSFLPKNKDFKRFQPNRGLEAIAAKSNGEIFAIPEEPPGSDSDFPIYKLTDGKWSIFARFPASGSFFVTDAVFLPDDDLLILERGYDWGVGFKMQLRILNFSNNTITGQTKLLSLNSGLHNHEGLSLWQNDSKDFFITSISDNNFLPFVNSEIKEFKLKRTHRK